MRDPSSIRVLHLSTYASGGAGRAAVRLHEGLMKLGVRSEMLVREGASAVPGVGTLPISPIRRLQDAVRSFDYLVLNKLRRRDARFFTSDKGRFGMELAERAESFDVVHLHWISQFVDQPAFFGRLNPKLPVVWTTHDLNPVTGGCHVPLPCERFTSHCGQCPQIRSAVERDASFRIFERKLRARHGKRITFVSPSRFIEEQVAAAPLAFRAPRRVIPLGLDTEVFFPEPVNESRNKLGLPPDRFLVGFVAHRINDPNKGLATLIQALAARPEDDLELVVAGVGEVPSLRGVRVRHMGALEGEDALRTFYSSLDLLVVPSTFESFGQTASEAAACGCPVIASNTSGLRDVVVHEETGWLFEPGSVEALCDTLRVAEHRLLEARESMRLASRARAISHFGLGSYSQSYLDLYRELLTDGELTS